jgi:hypothetical protein
MKSIIDKQNSYERQTEFLEWNIVQDAECPKLVLEWQLHAFFS